MTVVKHLWNMLNLPNNYRLVSQHTVDHDDSIVTLLRYGKDNGRTLGGEHISFTIDESNQLKGFMAMDLSANRGISPRHDEARSIALGFFKLYAGDIFDDLKVKWIAEHHECVCVNNKKSVISGMKVKCQVQRSGKYAWVIVGNHHQPITFERDIIWNDDMSVRTSEQWLHDQWLMRQIK